MEAVISGMAMIQAGLVDIILAGGMEHMSGVAYAVPTARWGCRLQNQSFDDMMIEALYCGSVCSRVWKKDPRRKGPLWTCSGKPYIMGHTTELIAQIHNISRQEMDEVALRSHNNAERATKEGDFKAEIVPIEIPQKETPDRL